MSEAANTQSRDMAGVCALRMLLLCTGIFALTDSSYAVSTIKFGFKIDVTKSPAGLYRINITEEAQPASRREYYFQHTRPKTSYKMEHLKPCTEYKHAVAHVDKTGEETLCKHAGQKPTELTTAVNKEDVEEGRCVSGHACYRSDWDIGSLMSASNNVPAKQCRNDPKVFCIKPGINDFCTTLTTTFTSTNCPKSSFSVKKSFSVDYLNGKEIKQKIPTELVAKIEPSLPPSCDDLTINYVCHENGKFNPMPPMGLSGLEPFTNYSCTGQVNKNNVTITNTPVIQFNIDCDLTIKITGIEVTDTSMEVTWTTTSQRCKDIFLFYPKFSYTYSCVPNFKHNHSLIFGSPEGGACIVDQLEPYTDYRCEVQPTYAGIPVSRPTSVSKKANRENYNIFHIRLVIFILLLTGMVTAVVVSNIYARKRRSKGDVNGDMVLEEIATYESLPQS
ncbi:uncharacterized protein LOC117831040 isoform X2 [Notolabrus celidotus]|uniref:uncharacterized protein LOC117831040 isoform X2 n=1 Tax=Notolabrus celidotus TaxID=1203425 RepID=UPI00149003BA|nr:uncharacterized protein LOC117831040 isoform X2 [Notolabrus celidotus]